MRIKINEVDLEPKEVLSILERRNPNITELDFNALFRSLDKEGDTIWECNDGVTVKNSVEKDFDELLQALGTKDEKELSRLFNNS